MFPMKNKSGDGVLPQIIVDGSKDQVEVDFACKCKEYGGYLKQTELYFLWQNSAEGGITELN